MPTTFVKSLISHRIYVGQVEKAKPLILPEYYADSWQHAESESAPRRRAVSERFVRVPIDDLKSVRVRSDPLKAIIKRHVLAHQELQHTLTEQAVLKRMAAESKDRLWSVSVAETPDDAPSPQTEASDPFLSFEGVGPPSSTTLAAYLTTVSNTPTMRQARVWKRFVRVRTDDLESVRVERAIKRVRSDLASHGVRSKTDPEEMTSSQTGETYDSSISTTGHTTQPKKRASKKKLLGPRKSTRKAVIDDFEMIRVLGKGCAGKVLLVKHKTTADLYALKAITKRHVLAHLELQHTLTEQAVLKRMAAESKDPFVVKLWWSFHDKENLFLVMDFHPGGDLATQLARWGRLGRDRARFYAAEIVEGVEGLHAAGVIYRDLKPENILIGGDGHIVLTDFGLSKAFPRRTAAITAPSTSSGSRSEFYSPAAPNVLSVNGSTVPATPPWMKAEKGGELAAGWLGEPVGQTADTTTTFCGTAEYLAPEVIQGLAYSYEVDWWSFGTMLYEMLTGITPFWANHHSDMYVRVLQDELQFPDDRATDQDAKSLIRGLLQRNPALRYCEPRIKRYPYFSMMLVFSHVFFFDGVNDRPGTETGPMSPYIPPIDPSNASDTQNFDDSVDVFDGYSFKVRHPVLLDDEDEEEGSESDEGDMPPKPSRLVRPRREKTRRRRKKDEEDDDRDSVEAADGEDHNGAKGTSVDAVAAHGTAIISRDLEATGTGTEASDSPSPSQHRGRTPGLTFRRPPRQFLRPKSPPPSSYSSKSSLSCSASGWKLH
ncbi:kinase-like domain-containing protein [Mycena rebaudengoi]|nr:kinase-like domain-containing protein [Mycena rebaudengoi]